MLSSVEPIIATGAVFVVFLVAFAFVAYALVRPFTHIHHHHESTKLWRPLP